MNFEKLLGHLAGDDEDSRIALVQVGAPGETPTLEMRYQRHSESLGWITQKRIRMAPGQVGDVRAALNMMDPDAREAEISPLRKAKTKSLEVVGDVSDERTSG